MNIYGLLGGSVVKNPPINEGAAGDEGLILGSEKCPGEGKGDPFQYSCLENSMDQGPWWATVHGVIKSWTQLRNQAHVNEYVALNILILLLAML